MQDDDDGAILFPTVMTVRTLLFVCLLLLMMMLLLLCAACVCVGAQDEEGMRLGWMGCTHARMARLMMAPFGTIRLAKKNLTHSIMVVKCEHFIETVTTFRMVSFLEPSHGHI